MFRMWDWVDAVGNLVRIALTIIAVGLILYAILGLCECRGAPVPPEQPLTSKGLVGQWDMKWGTHSIGWIVFEPDGFYWCRCGDSYFGQTWEPEYCGSWSLDGNRLSLHEGQCARAGSELAVVWTTRYQVRFSVARFGYASGQCGPDKVELIQRLRPKPITSNAPAGWRGVSLFLSS